MGIFQGRVDPAAERAADLSLQREAVSSVTANTSIPVMKPLLPSAEKLRPYLEQIDANRWYSNMGPLVVEFERRLARHFGVDADRIVTSSNGTLAMVQALRAMNVRPGSLCVMPAWTFVATPAAACAAGMRPYFVDVDPDTWAATPDAVRKVIKANPDVGAVIVVSPFGAPLDYEAWASLRAEGIPVLVDAAAGFDSLALHGTDLPTMVSLHATKVFGIGEGALVVGGDAEFTRLVRTAGNFGFQGSREAQTAGFNAKLSEYAAAVGLAAFDEWPKMRAEWRALSAAFMERASGLSAVRSTPGFGGDWISCYGIVELASGLSALRVGAALAARGIETRAWWGAGCHTHPAYRDCARTSLAHTEDLARRVLGLPFWPGLREEGLDLVFSGLTDALRA